MVYDAGEHFKIIGRYEKREYNLNANYKTCFKSISWKWNCGEMNATERLWWYVNIGSLAWCRQGTIVEKRVSFWSLESRANAGHK